MAVNAGQLTVTITLKSGAELYNALVELRELTEKQSETAARIAELSEFIRSQVAIESEPSSKI